MIVTVTFNFAVDVTYHVERIEPGETIRVDRVGRRAGGKGVNVARTLHALGREVAVVGFAGGFHGAAARAELRAAGMRDETVEIAEESRLTFMVVEEDGTATGFSERGARINPPEWDALRRRFEALLGEADGAVLSGSVPPGVPEDGYGQLVAAAREAGVPVVLDADGVWLLAGVRAGPTVVKINRAELRGVIAREDIVEGARELLGLGPETVVISSGEEGLVSVGAGAVLRARPPERLRGNPTGAGDAASAALILGLLDGSPWPDALADAAALSAAAVASPLAGSFDERTYAELRARIRAEPVGL